MGPDDTRAVEVLVLVGYHLGQLRLGVALRNPIGGMPTSHRWDLRLCPPHEHVLHRIARAPRLDDALPAQGAQLMEDDGHLILEEASRAEQLTPAPRLAVGERRHDAGADLGGRGLWHLDALDLGESARAR